MDLNKEIKKQVDHSVNQSFARMQYALSKDAEERRHKEDMETQFDITVEVLKGNANFGYEDIRVNAKLFCASNGYDVSSIKTDLDNDPEFKERLRFVTRPFKTVKEVMENLKKIDNL